MNDRTDPAQQRVLMLAGVLQRILDRHIMYSAERDEQTVQDAEAALAELAKGPV